MLNWKCFKWISVFHDSDIRYNSGINCSEPSWLQFKIPCPQPEDWEEEVYDDLCYVTFSSSFPEVGVVAYTVIAFFQCGQLILILFVALFVSQ